MYINTCTLDSFKYTYCTNRQIRHHDSTALSLSLSLSFLTSVSLEYVPWQLKAEIVFYYGPVPGRRNSNRNKDHKQWSCGPAFARQLLVIWCGERCGARQDDLHQPQAGVQHAESYLGTLYGYHVLWRLNPQWHWHIAWSRHIFPEQDRHCRGNWWSVVNNSSHYCRQPPRGLSCR
ncbi:hypothetical protein VTN77DRAFT_2472 [Rasamsonia byssochlamydoides]|uniref:uncharacterized protein n=1 Tax=Rasamsonia byssochlamydoides TaxID=89139 RepID=UPI003742A8D1